MHLPEFTPDERYLVDFFRNSSRRAQWWARITYDAYYFVPATILFGFGLQSDERWATILGFGMLLLHQVVESLRNAKWGDVLRSIILKYQQCLADGVPTDTTVSTND